MLLLLLLLRHGVVCCGADAPGMLLHDFVGHRLSF
jgi:hypothetical protein